MFYTDTSVLTTLLSTTPSPNNHSSAAICQTCIASECCNYGKHVCRYQTACNVISITVPWEYSPCIQKPPKNKAMETTSHSLGQIWVTVRMCSLVTSTTSPTRPRVYTTIDKISDAQGEWMGVWCIQKFPSTSYNVGRRIEMLGSLASASRNLTVNVSKPKKVRCFTTKV